MQTQKQILTDEFQKQADYQKKLSALLNDTSDQSIQSAGEILSKMKDNVYSFETDSGKSDLVSGKLSPIFSGLEMVFILCSRWKKKESNFVMQFQS